MTKGASGADFLRFAPVRAAGASLNRLIVIAVAIVAIAVAAPTFAPRLLDLVRAPPGQIEALPDRPAAVSAAAPPVRIEPAAPARDARTGGRTVALRADDAGQFEASAVINGRTVPVVVDTGATTVAISADAARQLGVAPPQSAYRLPISTANGTGYAAPVMLNEVRVGSISVRNVQAVVIPGKGLGISLLGMTFLSRLSKFELAKGQLVLTE